LLGLGLALCVLTPLRAQQQQQANPAGTASEQRSADKERGGVKTEFEREQEEREFKEADLQLPAYPKKDGLVEFRISDPGSFRYFVDAAAISIGKDEVVRYTLVVRSASGVENVSYEGMRCGSGTYKVFAYGNDGKWSPSRGDWRETSLRWEYELRTRYLCPMKLRVQSAAEAVDALKRGGHPTLANTGSGK
jgi:hypothetical protein